MSEEATHAPPSPLLLVGVYIGLMILLAMTVYFAEFVQGELGLLVALAIASAKALLVILFFMQARYAPSFTRIFVAAGFVWLSILFTLALLDYMTR